MLQKANWSRFRNLGQVVFSFCGKLVGEHKVTLLQQRT